jgi:hypothetical protein
VAPEGGSAPLAAEQLGVGNTTDASCSKDGPGCTAIGDPETGGVGRYVEASVVGPASASTEASGGGGLARAIDITDDVRDLTTAHAKTTNELKSEEIVIRSQETTSVYVTSDSGGKLRLDTGKRSQILTARHALVKAVRCLLMSRVSWQHH